jgi:hypothetical protein
MNLKMHPSERCIKCGSLTSIKQFNKAKTGVIKYTPEYLTMCCNTCGHEFARRCLDTNLPDIKILEEAHDLNKYHDVEETIRQIRGELNG